MTIDSILKIVQIASSIATIVGVIGLSFTIKSYRDGKEAQLKREKRQTINDSISVLEYFANEIIPNINKAEKEFSKTLNINLDESVKKINDNAIQNGYPPTMDKKNLPKEIRQKIVLTTKKTTGILGVLNEFEHVSVYMNYGLVDDGLVYSSVHSVFCKFIKRHQDLLETYQTGETSYQNVRRLYAKWSAIEEKKYLDKEKIKINNREKELDNLIKRG
ncbi:hypothetical protein GHU05_07220 [Fructobacillus tropaeoli]|uniref:DUF4760 domain-containing protein n=1 Tax=Fructobacillus tropaeoli TaxID=709323 RepID=UPI0014560A06|nr:hypothetical protein [Fructobacillus tropaeoli]NLS38710.1 hypothetical protein [Fructobacillus tropaeoli]